MTEQSSTVDDSTAPLTTTEITQQVATGSETTSSASAGAAFYFQCAVVMIGVVGTVANALILYALVASKQHKKQLLIVNLNALDLVGCIFLVITYSVKLCNIRLTGNFGFWLCATILSEAFVWWGTLGSKISIAIITIDRYLKVVHPVWSKKRLRKWMIYLAIAFTWSCSLIYSVAVNFTTTAVIDGVCYAAVIWKSEVVKMVHGVCNFTLFYVTILVIILFCYWRIVIVIRRQASVMAGYASNSAQAQTHQIQTNVTKTMILVSAFFAVTNFPVDCYFLLVNVNANVTMLDGGYYVTMFIIFMYSCTNPFIYATKFDPVKRTLLSMIPCKKNSVQPSPNLNAA